MGIYRRSRTTKGDLSFKKKHRLKRKTKDHDEVHDQLNVASIDSLKNRPKDEELPGFGQFYCFVCARHFIDKAALSTHNLSKKHKQHVKYLLKNPKYTQREADSAAGLGTYVAPIVDEEALFSAIAYSRV